MKSYHVIYNQDCTNLFAVTKESLTPCHVDRMVDEVADGGADLLLINPNAQRVNYPSRVWQTFWDGYAPGRREFFGPFPEADLPGRERLVRSMKDLADQNCDYLARAIARCRQKGIAPGVSVRMNDMHDVPWPGSHLFSRFYLEHPELRLDNGEFSGWATRGLNYEYPAVRDHYLGLIRELACEYDIDVLELDFLRFHCYFPRESFGRHTEIMTGFLREVRAILAGAGRPIALMARLPVTPTAAFELGFDVAAWAREGLVDVISAGAFLSTQWNIPVDEYKALVGDGVAVYACADYLVDRRPDLPERSLATDPLFLRGFAAGHLAAGADGVEFFNFFCARETVWEGIPKEPTFETLGQLRNLSTLRGMPKTYTLGCGCSMAEVDGPFQVPATLGFGMMRSFDLLLASEFESVQAEIDVIFTGGAVTADRLWAHVNLLPLGPARSITPFPGVSNDTRVATFAFPAQALREGRNKILIRNEENVLLTVLSIDVRIGQ
jgi:hypothetical protein